MHVGFIRDHESKAMHLAVDIGSGYTKYTGEAGRGFIPSAVGLYRDEGFLIGDHQENLVQIRDKRFIVGTSAKTGVPPEARENSLSRNWPSSEGYLALLYAAIGRLNPKGFKGELTLCTGLPLKFYKEDNDGLRKRLTGRHVFMVGGRPFDIEIHKEGLWTLPQAAGLFFNDVKKDQTRLHRRSGYFDWGTFTTGFAMFDGSEFVPWQSDGEPVGASALVEKLRQYCREQYQFTPMHQIALQFILDKTIRYEGQEVPIHDLLRRFSREVAKPLLDRVFDTLGGGKDARIVVGGGCGGEFVHAVQERFPHAVPSDSGDNPMFDVVDGYYEYMKAKIIVKRKGSRAVGV